ncbi:MAG: hypothetical protein PHC51_04385 [bacterium]|nr:hypothetical protein [bacterium]
MASLAKTTKMKRGKRDSRLAKARASKIRAKLAKLRREGKLFTAEK